MSRGEPPQGSGPAPAMATIPLSEVRVDLSLLNVLGPAFVRRHEVLPYTRQGQTLQVVTTRSGDRLLLDEIAFCTGLTVHAAAPEGGALPKVIEACIEAWDRGERTFVTTGSGGAVADGDLVYLEDLGSLAADPAPQGGFSFADPGQLADVGAAAGLADVGAAQPPPPVVDAKPTGPHTTDLPVVVDVAPRIPAASKADQAPAETPSDDDLIDDVELLDDVDLLEEELQDDVDDSPEWEPTPTGIPAHRPAEGLGAVLANADDAERAQLRRIGQSLGFEVVEAPGTADVLAELEQRSTDLLMLDANLRGTHPYSVARQLRSEKRHAGLAVVVAGRHPASWQLAQDLAKTYGVDAYLSKPFDPPTLLWTLETALTARRDDPVSLRDPERVAAAAKLLSQGTSLFRKGAVDEAVDLFRRGLDADPFAPKLHVSLAIALVKQREPFAAIEAFERALALDHTLTQAMQNLALLYEKKGFRNKAVELWTRTLHATKDEEKRIKLRSRIAKLL